MKYSDIDWPLKWKQFLQPKGKITEAVEFKNGASGIYAHKETQQSIEK